MSFPTTAPLACLNVVVGAAGLDVDVLALDEVEAETRTAAGAVEAGFTDVGTDTGGIGLTVDKIVVDLPEATDVMVITVGGDEAGLTAGTVTGDTGAGLIVDTIVDRIVVAVDLPGILETIV